MVGSYPCNLQKLFLLWTRCDIIIHINSFRKTDHNTEYMREYVYENVMSGPLYIFKGKTIQEKIKVDDVVLHLRILAMLEAKIPNMQSIKILKTNFLNCCSQMRKVKSNLKSALFTSMDPLSKIGLQIFERSYINRNKKQNVYEGSIVCLMDSQYP